LEEFMNFAVEVGSGDMMFLQSFMLQAFISLCGEGAAKNEAATGTLRLCATNVTNSIYSYVNSSQKDNVTSTTTTTFTYVSAKYITNFNFRAVKTI
jgi:hypothetical protein